MSLHKRIGGLVPLAAFAYVLALDLTFRRTESCALPLAPVYFNHRRANHKQHLSMNHFKFHCLMMIDKQITVVVRQQTNRGTAV